jgi:hypothetical protein
VRLRTRLSSRATHTSALSHTVTTTCGVTLAFSGMQSIKHHIRCTSDLFGKLLTIFRAWWVFFAALTIFFTSRWSTIDKGGFLVVPREKARVIPQVPTDEEAQEKTADPNPSRNEEGSPDATSGAAGQLVRNTSVFTWKNLSYTVNTPSGQRQLLNDVQGWVKPGK